MSSNQGWVFGPMSVGAASAVGLANDAVPFPVDGSHNTGWIFGPMAPVTAAGAAFAQDAQIATSNGRPPAALAGMVADNAYVRRVGGAGSQSGYAPFYDPIYADALPNIWSEGTGEATLAFSRLHDHWRLVAAMDWMRELQELDGSLRYVEVDDSTYGLYRLRSVIGACWYVFALLEGGIWGEPLGGICMRDIE